MLLKVLKVLNSGENYFVKVVNTYNNIGREVKDNFNLFERNEVATPTPFRLIGHDVRMNVSVENKIYGQVKINPIQAKKVGLDKVIDGPMTYNTKTIIRDGQLNVEKIECIVCYKTYFQLKKMGINIAELENTTSYPGKLVDIELKNLGIEAKGNFALEDIYNNISSINELKAKQKVLKALITSKGNEGQLESVFTPEQIELLKEHGLNEDLVYTGVDVQIEKTKETYEAQIIDFKLKKSACSSFKGMLQRVADGKVLNQLDTIQNNYYNELNFKLQNLDEDEKNEILSSKLKSIKAKLASIRLENVFIKLDILNSQALNVAANVNFKNLIIDVKTQNFDK